MDLKPLPYEKPAETKSETTSTKGTRHRKLHSRISRINKKKKSNGNSEKLLKKTCKKILGYLDGKGKKSLLKVKELEVLMHRSIMALHKDKRDISDKKKNNDRGEKN